MPPRHRLLQGRQGFAVPRRVVSRLKQAITKLVTAKVSFISFSPVLAGDIDQGAKLPGAVTLIRRE